MNFILLKALTTTILTMVLSIGVTAQHTFSEASLDDSFSFLEDESILMPSIAEKNLYYLDLEMIDGKLSDVQLVNDYNEVIFISSLKDTPSDALYELDFSTIEQGNYLLRIRTYKEEIKKDIIVE